MFNLKKYINEPDSKLRRYHKMCELVNLKPEHLVLDVGSGNGYSFENYNSVNEVVGLDIEPTTPIKRDKFTYVYGDGTNMHMFKDQQFDLAVSVGVFEHIRPYEKVVAMANEIQRVAKGYVIVIPDIYTVIEPHYQIPFWQLYPKFLKKFLAKHYNLGNYFKNLEGEYEDLVFFSHKKWKQIFPGAKTITYNHRAHGLVRNTIIYKSIEE